MELNIAVLAGDGIGPEVTKEGVKVLEAIAKKYSHKFNFNEGLIGAVAIDRTGDPFPSQTEHLCNTSDAIFFGAIGDPKYDNDPTAKVRPEQGLLRMRKALGLFANIRPVQAYESLIEKSPLKRERIQGADLVVYRELTGGIYFGEHSRTDDDFEAKDVSTYNRGEIIRISKLAFKAAQKRRKKLTLVDKANVLETSRLWREVVQDLAKEYPNVEVEYMFVDNAAMQMVQWPTKFDVILTENMFGDIISDESSVIAGSLGLLPSASIGGNALFEPIHGSYPEAAGQDIANPMASILSAAMLLDHFDLKQEAELVRSAVETCLENNMVTKDLNETVNYGTAKIGDFVVEIIESDTTETHQSLENFSIGQSTII